MSPFPLHFIPSAIITAFLVVAPLEVTSKGWNAELGWQSAIAKEGSGKGGDNGKGGGANGKGGGANGKGGGDSGKGGDNGKGGENGKGGDKGGKSGESGSGGNGKGLGTGSDGGEGKGKGKGDTQGPSGTASRALSVNPTGVQIRDIEIVHGNGMLERIMAGRYLMKDNKGRTIIERSATPVDLRRLRQLEREADRVSLD